MSSQTMSTQQQQTSSKDTQMKDIQSKEESKKGEVSQSERGIIPSQDLWKDFDDWYKSIFEDYSRIDQEMDRRFKDFSE